MTPFELLDSRFEGDAIDHPLAKSHFKKFEAKSRRKIPAPIRDFLLECNGIDFTSRVLHGDHEVLCFLDLWGIGRVLTLHGALHIRPPYFPFSQTLTNDYFCLKNDGSVHVTNTFAAPNFSHFKFDFVSKNLVAFIGELKKGKGKRKLPEEQPDYSDW